MHRRFNEEQPVVVCGAGAAGLAATIAAARRGVSVVLIEALPQPGGTVAGALIHTIAGLYDSSGSLLNSGLAAELAERLLDRDPHARKRQMGRTWVLNACPVAYRECILQWIGEEPSIAPWCRSRVTRVARAGGEIVALEISTPEGVKTLEPRSVIDATGTAEVTRLIDPALVVDDESRAAGGWVFRLRGVLPGALAFPKGVGLVRSIRAAADAGELPKLCGTAWFDSGVAPDEVYLKLMLPVPLDWQAPGAMAELEATATAAQQAILEFLRQSPDFAAARVAKAGSLGVRDGGRIRGRYVLTGDDVRRCRRFDDAVCRAAWPIEYWDPERGVSLEYLPPETFYEIPMRSLQLESVENFWVAGKCLSADRYAHASARVAGTCWAMGEAAGRAAAGNLAPADETGHDAALLH
jgi:hypothetical protein